LELDRFRFSEAFQLQTRAVHRYSRYGHLTGVAKVLIQLGRVHAFWGTPERGLGVVTKALRILGPESRNLKLAGLSVLVHLLIEAGLFEVAAEEAQRIGPLIGHALPRLDRLHFEWAKARIDRGLGNYEAAISKLVHLRDRFAEERLTYDLSLVSVELALVFLEHGKKRKPTALAAESSRLIAQTKIDPEVLLAFLHPNEFHEGDLRSILGIS
jgi:hypothetical protein